MNKYEDRNVLGIAQAVVQLRESLGHFNRTENRVRTFDDRHEHRMKLLQNVRDDAARALEFFGTNG